jgi:hypothetical protein
MKLKVQNSKPKRSFKAQAQESFGGFGAHPSTGSDCSRRGSEAELTAAVRRPIRLLTSAAAFFRQAPSLEDWSFFWTLNFKF